MTTSEKPKKFKSFFRGQNVFKTSKSETNAPVILVISDFKIADVLESKVLNSFSKNSIEERRSKAFSFDNFPEIKSFLKKTNFSL